MAFVFQMAFGHWKPSIASTVFVTFVLFSKFNKITLIYYGEILLEFYEFRQNLNIERLNEKKKLLLRVYARGHKKLNVV